MLQFLIALWVWVVRGSWSGVLGVGWGRIDSMVLGRQIGGSVFRTNMRGVGVERV